MLVYGWISFDKHMSLLRHKNYVCILLIFDKLQFVTVIFMVAYLTKYLM